MNIRLALFCIILHVSLPLSADEVVVVFDDNWTESELEKSPDDTRADPKKPFAFTVGDDLELRYFNLLEPDGSTGDDQVEYKILLRFNLTLGNGWAANVHAQTGDEDFTSGHNNLGIGNGTSFNSDFKVPRAYIDYSAAAETIIQCGALTTNPRFIKVGGFYSIDNDGWIDGCRLNADNLVNKHDLALALGRVGDLSKSDVWDRSWREEETFAQLHVNFNLARKSRILFEGTRFAEESYLRIAAQIPVNRFINTVKLEEFYQISQSRQLGFALLLEKTLSKRFDIGFAYVNQRRDFKEIYPIGNTSNNIAGDNLNIRLSYTAGKTEDVHYYLDYREAIDGDSARSIKAGIKFDQPYRSLRNLLGTFR